MGKKSSKARIEDEFEVLRHGETNKAAKGRVRRNVSQSQQSTEPAHSGVQVVSQRSQNYLDTTPSLHIVRRPVRGAKPAVSPPPPPPAPSSPPPELPDLSIIDISVEKPVEEKAEVSLLAWEDAWSPASVLIAVTRNEAGQADIVDCIRAFDDGSEN